jgi:hypothetical protein
MSLIDLFDEIADHLGFYICVDEPVESADPVLVKRAVLSLDWRYLNFERPEVRCSIRLVEVARRDENRSSGQDWRRLVPELRRFVLVPTTNPSRWWLRSEEG